MSGHVLNSAALCWAQAFVSPRCQSQLSSAGAMSGKQCRGREEEITAMIGRALEFFLWRQCQNREVKIEKGTEHIVSQNPTPVSLVIQNRFPHAFLSAHPSLLIIPLLTELIKTQNSVRHRAVHVLWVIPSVPGHNANGEDLWITTYILGNVLPTSHTFAYLVPIYRILRAIILKLERTESRK